MSFWACVYLCSQTKNGMILEGCEMYSDNNDGSVLSIHIIHSQID